MEPTPILFLVFGVTGALLVLLILRPAATASRGGKILAFLGLFILPVTCVVIGTHEHLERSKQTQFCLSCHIMEPYGRSLHVDDPGYLAAAHFQNHRIPPDQACYTCHTDYTLYGGLRAKLRGLRHVYVQYLGTPKQPIRLYQAYNNRECLHCHLGARSFEESATHAAMQGDLVSNQMSCLTVGCHNIVHNVAQLNGVKTWSPSR